jgi:Chaperone of endosialidase
MAIVLDGTAGISAPGLETFGDGTALGGATNPIVSMAKGANNYVQGYIVNNTNGANSSADLVCYPSNGTDSSGWIDMGITGPTFSQAAYGITGANEGYIFMSALSGSGKTGNLVLATDSTGTQNAIKFATGGFGSTTERMRIDSSGNVGIGTSSPAFKLNVYDATSCSIVASTPASDIQIAASSSGYGIVGTYNNYALVFRTNAAERARIDTSGNLLVGTTSALSSGKISVAFDGTPNNALVLRETAGYSGAGYVVFHNPAGSTIGSITRVALTNAVIYNTTSDQRLKSNIEDAAPVLEKLMDVKVRQYDWTEGDLHQDYGFVAQELEPLLSGIVTKGKEDEDMWQMDYSRLTPHLLKAIQEQQALIEQLRADIEVLKA